VPKRLEAAGFSFGFPEVAGFLGREFAEGG
jgi:hypothetical protein